MATLSEEVRVPLLASQDSSQDELGELKEEFDVQYHLENSKRGLYSRVGTDGVRASQGAGGDPGGLKRVGSEYSAVTSARRLQQYSGSEMIVAVFVVAFDTKKGKESYIKYDSLEVLIFTTSGNIVEWKYPSEVVLEGIEFKSMASGLHKIQKDFM